MGLTPLPYTGRFFRPSFFLCSCLNDGPPCSCVVSPAVVPAAFAACAAVPLTTDELEETALATLLARVPLLAIPLLATQ